MQYGCPQRNSAFLLRQEGSRRGTQWRMKSWGTYTEGKIDLPHDIRQQQSCRQLSSCWGDVSEPGDGGCSGKVRACALIFGKHRFVWESVGTGVVWVLKVRGGDIYENEREIRVLRRLWRWNKWIFLRLLFFPTLCVTAPILYSWAEANERDRSFTCLFLNAHQLFCIIRQNPVTHTLTTAACFLFWEYGQTVVMLRKELYRW